MKLKFATMLVIPVLMLAVVPAALAQQSYTSGTSINSPDKRKKKERVPDAGVMPIMAITVGVIGGAVALASVRRSRRTAS
jgi:hypothetical protein